VNKFIKLTELNSDGGEKEMLVNSAYIQYMQVGKRGDNVRIVMVEEKQYFFVKETVKEIWEMLQ